MNINRERIKQLFLELKDSIRKIIAEDFQIKNVHEAREIAKQKDEELQEILKSLNDHERVVFMSLARQFQDYIGDLNISRMSVFSHCSKLEVFDALLGLHNTDKDVDTCIEEYKKFVNPEDEEKVDTSDIEITFESDELQKLRNSLYGYCFFIEDGNTSEARKVIVKLEEQNKDNSSFLQRLDKFYEKHNDQLLSLNSTEKVEELLKEYAIK